jgi:hypothetical protein
MITHIDISNKLANILDIIYYKNVLKLFSIKYNNKINLSETSILSSKNNLNDNVSSSETPMKENIMNLSNKSEDKELFSEMPMKENAGNKMLNKVFYLTKFPILKPDYFVFMQYYFIYLFLYHLNYKNTIRYSISLHLFHIMGLLFKNLLKKYEYTPIHNISYLKDVSYILFIYLFFIKLLLLKKIFLLTSFSIFYSLININIIYKERLKSIENKELFTHPLKILIITPNKNTIEKIIKKTNIFNFTNFLFFVNIFIYWLI